MNQSLSMDTIKKFKNHFHLLAPSKAILSSTYLQSRIEFHTILFIYFIQTKLSFTLFDSYNSTKFYYVGHFTTLC
jgi:hypothetical protein